MVGADSAALAGYDMTAPPAGSRTIPATHDDSTPGEVRVVAGSQTATLKITRIAPAVSTNGELPSRFHRSSSAGLVAAVGSPDDAQTGNR
jgi:hypothetical protein